MEESLSSIVTKRLIELESRRLMMQGAIERMTTEMATIERKIETYRMALTLEGAPVPASLASRQSAPVGEIEEGRPTTAKVGSKMSQIRHHIAGFGGHGFEPKQIARFVRETGMSPHNAFAYNAIKRLKDSGELVEDNGNYFPTGKLREALGQEKMPFPQDSAQTEKRLE